MTTQKNAGTQAVSTTTTRNTDCPVAWVTASICYYFAVLTVMVYNFIFEQVFTSLQILSD
jgi:hypothetical protein